MDVEDGPLTATAPPTPGTPPETDATEAHSADNAAPDTPDELTLARELVLKAHPQIVPELIVGGSLAEMLASVPAAEAAFERVVASTRGAVADGAPVPGGGAVRSTAISVEGLGPMAKIRAGIGQS